MMLRSTQAPRPTGHRFSTLTFPHNATRIGNTVPTLVRPTSPELSSRSALFLVPRSPKPRLAREWKPRMADGLFLAVTLAAMVALFWTLL